MVAVNRKPTVMQSSDDKGVQLRKPANRGSPAAPPPGSTYGTGSNQRSGGMQRSELPRPTDVTDELGCSRQPTYQSCVGRANLTSAINGDQRNGARPQTARPPPPTKPKPVGRVLNLISQNFVSSDNGPRDPVSSSSTATVNSKAPGARPMSSVECQSIYDGPYSAVQSGATKRTFRNSADISHWIQNKDDDDDAGGQYIDRRVVESVLRCRQMLSTGANKLRNMRLMQHPQSDSPVYGSGIGPFDGRPTLDDDFSRHRRIPGDLALKVETADIDHDSGISGDRNSASSTSSGLSVESSLTSLSSAEDYTTGDRTSSSSTMSCSSSMEQLNYAGTKNVQRSAGLVIPSVAVVDSQPVCIPCDNSNVVLRDRSATVPTASEEYGSLTKRKSASVSPVDRHRLSRGNITTDLLKTAEGASDVSPDLLVRLRMKRNTIVLTSRRLQRQMTGQTHTSVPPTASGARLRGTAESSCNQQPSDHLSKEEVGEILVQELERRRNNDGVACGATATTTAIRSLPVNRGVDERLRQKYEDMVRRQLKTFTAKDMRNWDNVENCRDIYGCVASGPLTQPTGDTRLVEDPVSAGISTRLAGLRCTEQLPGCAAPRVDGRRYNNVLVENALNSNQSSAMRHSVSDHDFRLPLQPSLRSTAPVVTDGELSAVNTDTADDNAAVRIMHRRSVPDLKVLDGAKSNSVMAASQGGRKKKTVTFSDNVKLVCIAPEETIPVTDCAARYPSGILKNSGPSRVNLDLLLSAEYASNPLSSASADVDLGRDSDGASADDSEPELDEMSPDGRPRCGLCRRKWADRGATYCLDCRAYMSKLQPTAL